MKTLEINYTTTPKSTEGYFEVLHNDLRDEYVKTLTTQLRERHVSVCTEREDVSWVRQAIAEVPGINERYRITAIVEFTHQTTAFGIFHFDAINEGSQA